MTREEKSALCQSLYSMIIDLSKHRDLETAAVIPDLICAFIAVCNESCG